MAEPTSKATAENAALINALARVMVREKLQATGGSAPSKEAIAAAFKADVKTHRANARRLYSMLDRAGYEIVAKG